MAAPVITRTTWTDAPPDASATVINNAQLQLIYDKIDDVITRIVTVRKNSAGTEINQGTLNFIEGANITLTIAEDTSAPETDITIAAAGGNTALDVTWTTVTDDLTATGTTNIISVTEKGVLLGLGIQTTTAISGGTPDSTIEITIDGGTTRSFNLHVGAVTWEAGQFIPWTSLAASGGNTDNNHGNISLWVPYAVSLTVAHNISDAASSAGAIAFTVIKGLEL